MFRIDPDIRQSAGGRDWKIYIVSWGASARIISRWAAVNILNTKLATNPAQSLNNNKIEPEYNFILSLY